MAKIKRPDKNIRPFAENATGLNRTVFGDRTQSDELNDNYNRNFVKGWEIVGVNDAPTKQDFNAFGYTIGGLLAYLYQTGVAEWSEHQEYHAGAIALYSKELFKSLVDDNTGNQPNTSSDKWVSLEKILVSQIIDFPTSLPANGGRADVASKLQTPRKINGVAFDGTTDITVKAEELAKSCKINGVAFDGSKDIDLAIVPIGTIFPSLLSPDNSKGYKYVMLTGGWQKYNAGLIVSEDIRQEAHTSNTTSLNYGTTLHCIGTIGKIGSPMDGWKIRLINSEKRYIRAGHWGVYDDAIRNIYGKVVSASRWGYSEGAFIQYHTGGVGDTFTPRFPCNDYYIDFNAARLVPTGHENRPRTVEFVYYMRIL